MPSGPGDSGHDGSAQVPGEEANAIDGAIGSAMVGNVRIVFGGDSNMNANGASEGPRLDVHTLLSADIATGDLPASMTLTYIGPINNGTPPTDHHMGESGSTIEDWTSAGTDFPGAYFGVGKLYNCDLWIFSIGTNNCNSDVNLALGLADYAAMLQGACDKILSVNPWARFVVADVLPSTDAARQTRIDSLNATVASTCATLVSSGYRITHVGTPSGLTGADYNDSIHLSPSGQAKWAAVLYAGARTALGWPI